LREIYAAQGIAVTDEVLAAGVGALREERFTHTPPPPSFARTLAHAYVTRGRWGKLAGGAVAVVAVAALAFQLFVRGPALREATEVPADLQSAYQTVVATTSDADALETARSHLTMGEAAVAQGDFDAARAATQQLETLSTRLNLQYEVRVVSRPGEQSGVWRVPDDNRGARNYYLIVEALDPRGDVLRIPITSEEDGRTRAVSAWGLRVDEPTFQRVAADKGDDGIIQDNVVGRKRRGVLEREYTVPTTGAAITEW
jgi:hypothetical protein